VPELLAILALLIWSSLAVSAVALTGVPALFSTGIALAIGGACGLPWIRWRELSRSAVLLPTLNAAWYQACSLLLESYE